MSKEIQLHVGDEIIYYNESEDKQLEENLRKEKAELKDCVVIYDESSNLTIWIKQTHNSKNLGK